MYDLWKKIYKLLAATKSIAITANVRCILLTECEANYLKMFDYNARFHYFNVHFLPRYHEA